jgi:hypothetical protein
MTGSPGSAGSPGSLEDEAALLAGAALGWLHRVSAGRLPEPSPDVAMRLTEAVTEFAVAGAGLARVLTELATSAMPSEGRSPTGGRTNDGPWADEDDPTEPPHVERIDIH